MIDVATAVRALVKNSECRIESGKITIWRSEEKQPTEAEINAKLVELETEYNAQAYSRNRQTEYPSIQECVHAILDNDNNELDTLQAKRAEIKLKYPKGG